VQQNTQVQPQQHRSAEKEREREREREREKEKNKAGRKEQEKKVTMRACMLGFTRLLQDFPVPHSLVKAKSEVFSCQLKRM
jgi:hypothetical protein